MQKGMVYLLVEYGSSPERYKIGITRGDIKTRIKSLQTGCSNELMLIKSYNSTHYLKIEKYLHNIYNKYYLEDVSISKPELIKEFNMALN